MKRILLPTVILFLLTRWTPADAQAAPAQPHTAAPGRPQTPLPPLPYHSDSVEYDNADKTVHFGATLTYPEKGGPFPAAILITGSGTQDRDETIFGHHPFAVIADYLTKKGYAVLRVDDRGAGLSTGDVKKATTAVFAKDVETSFAWLKTRKEIDPRKIGLIGHSEGGMIAPIVAAENKDIAFIISLAGPFSGDSTTMYQVESALRQYHTPAPLAQYTLVTERIVLENVKVANDTATLMKGIDRDYRAYYATIPDSLRSKDLVLQPTPDNFVRSIAPKVLPAFSPWWKFYIAYDATPYYSKVKCPVLLLGGAKDIQVDNTTDIPRLAAILKAHNNSGVETHLMPDLNHLFQHCNTCTIAEYSKLEETFSPEVLEIMAAWLDANLHK
jgi:pimeloyl-ACP methyl ester carboxylesterase